MDPETPLSRAKVLCLLGLNVFSWAAIAWVLWKMDCLYSYWWLMAVPSLGIFLWFFIFRQD
jgi:hypothetical protein